MSKVYVAKALIQLFTRAKRQPPCNCGAAAEYIQVNILPKAELGGIVCWQSCYCSACVGKAAKRRGMAILDTEAQVREIYTATCLDKQRAHDELVTVHREREAREMELHGKLLRMSGLNGAMYLMRDGTLSCVLKDGRVIRPCCWLEGGRIIDNRIRGRLATGHSEGCKPSWLKGIFRMT